MKLLNLILLGYVSVISCFSINGNNGVVKMNSKLSMNFLTNFNKKPVLVDLNELKSNIINQAKGTSNGIKASSNQKQIISDNVKLLEKQNKITKISSSPKLNGTWQLLYTTNEGSSAGKVGPFIGNVFQIIDQPQKTYVNKVTILNNIFDATLSANWKELKPQLWQVQFLDLKFKLFGTKLSESKFNDVTGIWRTTYLDDNMRILYAIGGKNTKIENIYILTKDEKK